jgi:hypothetical protein
MVTKLYTIQLPAAEMNFVPDTCASTSQSKTPHTFGNVQVPRAGSLHRDIFGVSCWGLGPDDYELVTHFSTFRPVPCSVRFHINSVKRERERTEIPEARHSPCRFALPRSIALGLSSHRWACGDLTHTHVRRFITVFLFPSLSCVGFWFLASSFEI